MVNEGHNKKPNDAPIGGSDEPIESSETTPTVLSKRRIGLFLGGVLLLGGLGFLGLRSMAAKPDKPAGRNARQQVTPVMVAAVSQRTVPVQLKAIGNVQANSTVSVTPQASGRITGVFFQKGQEVHKGQLLFTLDDRSQTASIQQAQGTVAKSQAQVQQARATLAKDQGLVEQARATLAKDQGAVKQAIATLAKDQAQAQFAQAQSQRYENLYKQGAISQDQAQQYATNSRSIAATLQVDQAAIENAQAVVRSDEVAIKNAQAVVLGDQAAIENAQAGVSADSGALNSVRVESSYTKIYAPIDGRAGNILVTEGNVVQAGGSNPLVTIAKIHPIQVAFSVPESNLPDVQKHMDNGKLKVSVTFAGNNTPIQGLLSFANNTVDTNTGTIQLIGDFDNADARLFPGQFVNTTLTLTQEPNATVVPSQAVQNGSNGQFVFVFNPDDNTVDNVPVVASSTIDGLDVIQKGVQPGDQVVTDGQANLVDGSQVRVKTASEQGNGGNGTAPGDMSGNNSQPNRKTAKPASGNAPNAGDAPNAGNAPRSSRQPKPGNGSQRAGDN